MKIVVIGGTGLIGTMLVNRLRQGGHDVVAASPNSGVNTVTGEGLASALAGAEVVVDVANSPSLDDRAALEFFETSGRHLLAAEAAAGVRHHVALSIVGADRLPQSGYLRAKLSQEQLIRASEVPFTIVPLDTILRIHERPRAGRDRGENRPSLAGAPAADRR
jgi:uncharacterized protein YbjT (DUF2867 family)